MLFVKVFRNPFAFTEDVSVLFFPLLAGVSSPYLPFLKFISFTLDGSLFRFPGLIYSQGLDVQDSSLALLSTIFSSENKSQATWAQPSPSLKVNKRYQYLFYNFCYVTKWVPCSKCDIHVTEMDIKKQSFNLRRVDGFFSPKNFNTQTFFFQPHIFVSQYLVFICRTEILNQNIFSFPFLVKIFFFSQIQHQYDLKKTT